MSSSRDNRSELDDILFLDAVVGGQEFTLADGQVRLGNQLEAPEEIRNPAYAVEFHLATGIAKNHLHWNNETAVAASPRIMAITTTQVTT